MKKWLIILFVFLVVIILLLAGVYVVFFKKNTSKGNGSVIENPINQIIIKNTDASGNVNSEAVVNEGIEEFNAEYINYLLIALGVGDLRKSMIGYGNPIIEFVLDNQVWNSEIREGVLYTAPGGNNNKDLMIIMPKQEAVKALLSSDMKQFMKDSVANGNTKLEMIAGNPELLSKEYLDLYNRLK